MKIIVLCLFRRLMPTGETAGDGNEQLSNAYKELEVSCFTQFSPQTIYNHVKQVETFGGKG